MTASQVETNMQQAARHAVEAERLLRGKLISAHIKAQAHATLAVYYAAVGQLHNAPGELPSD
ncbi:MAG TPA: hypothetical protein VEH52_11415 [Gaiellaceae bacterium]|nr:hypothetical protein [Gaiellaceae bacterium]